MLCFSFFVYFDIYVLKPKPSPAWYFKFISTKVAMCLIAK